MIDLTALILTYNEEANIGRTLTALRWLDRIVLLDSFSTDRTLEIACATHPGIRVVQRAFDSFAGQCNFGLAQIASEWVLSLDADYVVSPQLADEIGSLPDPSSGSGYRVNFVYAVGGRPLRATLLPPRMVLYQRAQAKYRDEGHSHRVTVAGTIGQLNGVIVHDDRKPLGRWFAAQMRYAEIEAAHLLATDGHGLPLQDRIRKWIVPAPWLVFFYTLFGKGLILDGWRGWFYAVQRLVAELLLSLELLTRRGGFERR